jgi:hypothetical protein
MPDIEFAGRVEQIGEGTSTGNGADRQRGDELLRSRCHDRAYLRAPLCQAAGEIKRFIGGNSSPDDKQDAASGQCRRLRDRMARHRSGPPGGPLSGPPSRDGKIARTGIRKDVPDFVLHRAPMTCGPHAQPLLYVIPDISDGEAAHGLAQAVIAMQSL